MTETDALIVGAGHNGLVAAAYLARAGLRVEVFEGRPFVGGASVTEELWPGHFFSTCAHMVHALHPKLIRDLRLRERGLEIIPRTFYVYLRPDGTYVGPAEHASPRNLGTPDTLSAAERAGEAAYAAYKVALRAVFAPDRLQPPPTLGELRRRVAGTPAAEVLERALGSRVSELHRAFLPSERLRERYAAEVAAIGRDPLALSLAYASIDEPEDETGEIPANGYVRGGMGTLSRLLAEAAREAGARIHVGTPVERILTEGDLAVGVRLADGADVRSRLVVSNLDPKRTFLRLIEPAALDPAFRRRVAGLTTDVSCLKLLAVISDGCIWHVQHAGEHLFWNRPLPELAAYRAPLRQLYLCGAGQHPGGEVSGIPGHNAAHAILADLDRGQPEQGGTNGRIAGA